MESNAGKLTVHACTPEAARPSIEKLAALSCDSRNVTIDDWLRNADCFEVRLDGAPAVHYALKRVRRSNGAIDGFIVAAKGRAKGIDLTASVLPFIEKQMADCDTLEIRTKRRGLGVKLAQQGYQFSGVILRKNLK